MGVIILAGLTVFLLSALISACIHCMKIEKSILDITAIVEHRVLEMYETKR